MLKWADVSAVRAELSSQIASLLGPETEADKAAAAAPKKKAYTPSSAHTHTHMHKHTCLGNTLIAASRAP